MRGARFERSADLRHPRGHLRTQERLAAVMAEPDRLGRDALPPHLEALRASVEALARVLRDVVDTVAQPVGLGRRP
jgi:hypothetical protein